MSALSEPVESLDKNKPLALTKSIHTFNEMIKMYIGEMTGQVRKPYHGLSMRCRGDQCTYKLKTEEIIADGNCLFDSLLYILGWRQTDAARMDLRRELYHHFKINNGDHNHEYDLEDAKTNKHIYASSHVLKSFVELYRRHVIVFELHNSGVFNAHIFINRRLPFHEVDFLILTQNPGHFTTFTKDRGFVQSRAFLEKILDIDSYIPGSKLRDLIVPGQTIADFNERNYTQRIFSNYDEFMDVMTSVPAGLAPLLPLNAFPMNRGVAIGAAMMDPGSGSSGSRDMFASDADLARMYANGTPKSARSRSPRSRSASLSPATKAQIAKMNALGRSPRSGSHGSRRSGSRSASRRSASRRSGSGSLSPATKAEVARMNALARRRSRNASLSPATKKAIARMNKSSALKQAANVSPATKERIARLALSEAPNASINTMNQIGRLQKRMTQKRNPLGNGGAARAGSISPPADLRRTRRFKPSSIVGRALARPFARIFGKF